MKCLKCFTAGYSEEGHAVSAKGKFELPHTFDDETGAHHVHGEGMRETTYECDRGHSWTLKAHRHCYADKCEWNKTHRDTTQWHAAATISDPPPYNPTRKVSA